MNQPPDDEFATTQWTRVLLSQGSTTASRAALSELCTSYYRPVECFIQRTLYRQGEAFRDPDRAKELTHSFFAKLLEGDQLQGARPSGGKFRSYLLGAVKHFLLDDRKAKAALKRGGAVALEALPDAAGDDALRHAERDRHGFPSDAAFDRDWAVTLIEQALEGLKSDDLSSATTDLERQRFDWLQRHLLLPADEHDVQDVATLGWSDGAMRVALHRFRKRFKHRITALVTSTISDPSEVSAEIAYLIRAFSQQADSSD